MQPFPHHYTISAAARPESDVTLNGERLPGVSSAPPAEFDGPGDRWSPETLVVAAVADCFVLTFRAIAKLSKLSWTTLTCEASGTVDRADRVTQFTAFSVRASLEVPDGTNEEQAKRLLARAEQTCLVTNSLKAPCHLETDVRVAQATIQSCVQRFDTFTLVVSLSNPSTWLILRQAPDERVPETLDDHTLEMLSEAHRNWQAPDSPNRDGRAVLRRFVRDTIVRAR